METPESETPARRKSFLPYLIGAALVIILTVATFLAGRYLNAGVGPLKDEDGNGSELKPAAELPQTEPETMGVVLERNDNIILVGPASRISMMVPKPGSGGEPVMDVDYTGDKVEVVVSNETMIYRDTTTFDRENAPEIVQQTVELSTIDDIAPQSVVTVWGRKAGDRIIADVIEFSSPFVAHKGAP
jgi:hypothetical protein